MGWADGCSGQTVVQGHMHGDQVSAFPSSSFAAHARTQVVLGVGTFVAAACSCRPCPWALMPTCLRPKHARADGALKMR